MRGRCGIDSPRALGTLPEFDRRAAEAAEIRREFLGFAIHVDLRRCERRDLPGRVPLVRTRSGKPGLAEEPLSGNGPCPARTDSTPFPDKIRGARSLRRQFVRIGLMRRSNASAAAPRNNPRTAPTARAPRGAHGNHALRLHRWSPARPLPPPQVQKPRQVALCSIINGVLAANRQGVFLSRPHGSMSIVAP